MDISSDYSLTGLNTNSACFMLSHYVTVDSVRLKLGETETRWYYNTTEQRQKLAAEVPEPYLSAVMAVWGGTPTVAESVEGGDKL